MIAVVVETVLPGRAYRCNETIHPYTMNRLEVEVQVGERWVEVLKCRARTRQKSRSLPPRPRPIAPTVPVAAVLGGLHHSHARI